MIFGAVLVEYEEAVMEEGMLLGGICGLEYGEGVFELANAIAHAGDASVKMFRGGDDEAAEIGNNEVKERRECDEKTYRVPCPVARLPIKGVGHERGE